MTMFTPTGGRSAMKRRALLKALPAAVAVSAVPTFAVAVESPIAAMHREILRLREIANVHEESAVADAACDRMMDLADAIVDLPARNADDMLRKIMGYTVNGDHEIGDGPQRDAIWEEARALIGGVA